MRGKEFWDPALLTLSAAAYVRVTFFFFPNPLTPAGHAFKNGQNAHGRSWSAMVC